MQIIPHYRHVVNVHPYERLVSVVAGAALTATGLSKRSRAGIALALGGLEMVRRGVSGYSFVYEAFGIRTAPVGQGASVSLPYELGVRMDQSIVIHRPPEEVYRFWRHLPNMAQFMANVQSVTDLGGKRSHWKVKAPGGRTMEWDAVIHNELVNELIAWRSLPEADVDHAGSVWFAPTPDGRGTEIQLEMQFNPPGGAVGALLASLWGADPDRQLRSDLLSLKRTLERVPVA